MNNLKKFREARKLTITDVSEATGIVRSTLSAFESGKRKMNDKHAAIIARFFDVSVDEILGDESIRGSASLYHATKNLVAIYSELFYSGKLNDEDAKLFLILKSSSELSIERLTELSLHASRLLISEEFGGHVK